MTVTVPAFAKINLFLDIASLRADNYHNIVSLMQSVSLHDSITVEYRENGPCGITVFCDNAVIPTEVDNLVYKAAAAFPVKGEIRITIEKRIPVSAGLAGGSADAAATLVALNKLTGEKLSTEDLKRIGARLGADIPFCISGGAALVEGIGDRMSPVEAMPSFPIVIAKKGDGMSTPAAYHALDEKYDRFKDYKPSLRKLTQFTSPDARSDARVFCQGLHNLFETVVEPQRPAICEIKKIMTSFGSAGTLMSGSGTAVFGIFQNEDDAFRAREALKQVGADAHLCYPTR